MAELRERISAAARELYLSEGLEGVSMRRVAERVGVSAPAIYRHFGSKDELLSEIVVRAMRLLADYLEPALDEPSPRERIRSLCNGYLRFALEQPKYFDFAFLGSHRLGSIAGDLTRPGMDTFRLAIEQVEACMRDGTMQQDDPMETALALWATVHGLITLYRTGKLGDDEAAFGALYGKVLDRVVGGASD